MEKKFLPLLPLCKTDLEDDSRATSLFLDPTLSIDEKPIKSVDKVVYETTNTIGLVFAIGDLIFQTANEHKEHIIDPFTRMVSVLDRPTHFKIVPLYCIVFITSTLTLPLTPTTIRHLPKYILL